MMRTITVISTKTTDPKEFTSNASTWGELKSFLTSHYGSLDGMKAIVKESRTTLEMDGAELPSGSFTLFLTQTKIKAGALNIAAIVESMRVGTNNVYNEILSKIEEGYFGQQDDQPTTGGSKLSEEDKKFLAELREQL